MQSISAATRTGDSGLPASFPSRGAPLRRACSGRVGPTATAGPSDRRQIAVPTVNPGETAFSGARGNSAPCFQVGACPGDKAVVILSRVTRCPIEIGEITIEAGDRKSRSR